MLAVVSVLGAVLYCAVAGGVYQVLITRDPDDSDMAGAAAIAWIIALPALAFGGIAIRIADVGARAAKRLMTPRAKLLSPKELLKRYPADE